MDECGRVRPTRTVLLLCVPLQQFASGGGDYAAHPPDPLSLSTPISCPGSSLRAVWRLQGSGSDDSAAAGQAAEAGPGGPEGARFPSAAGRDGSAVSSPAMEPDPAHSTECSTDSLGTEGGSEVGEEANAGARRQRRGTALVSELSAGNWSDLLVLDTRESCDSQL